MLSYQGGRVTRSIRRRETFDIAGGQLTITGTKLRILASSKDGTTPEERLIDYIAGLSFLPRRGTRSKMFTLSVQRRAHSGGVASSIPHLSVNFVLPTRSPVFRIVRDGTMEEFLQMLQNGKASVRDHDQYGASLLDVSG